ncbi:MAG: glycosyltransferase [Hydrogenophaga sp.]|nr:glycosyltransferase [Hydrogenophaga sp.]
MSPQLMLSLWRERWGKAEDSVPTLPYLDGHLNRWSVRLMTSKIWTLPGAFIMTALLCMFGMAVIVSLQLSLNSQIVFSTVIVCVSLYVRRYGGHWVTLVLVVLSFIVSARYFFWRLDATLGHYFDLAFILGFCLFAAELHIWVLSIVNALTGALPLKRAAVPLSTDATHWATVDVFILCHGQSVSAIERAARSAFDMVWSKEKIKIYLVDDVQVDSIRTLARSMGISYLVNAEGNAGKTSSLNQALYVTEGEWLVIFDGDQAPDKNFLTNIAGWWNSDEKLGMIQTPFHFLAPEPSKCSLKIIENPQLGGSCAAIRRSMLLQAGGFSPDPVTKHAHTALKLQALGLTCAYVGFVASGHRGSEQRAFAIESQTLSIDDTFRVDQPFSCLTLRWKRYLSTVGDMLDFYRNVPILIFFMAPVVYFSANLNLIQTSPDLLAAYGLPHLLQGYFAQARTEGKPRFSMLTELKEIALGGYILLSTAIAVVRAEFRLWIPVGLQPKVKRQEVFDPLMAWPYAIVLVLNLVSFAGATIQMVFISSNDHEMTIFYFGWVGYNLLILGGMLAIAEESRHIREQARLKARLPATVRLLSGHAITCITVNFPKNFLQLDLAESANLKVGSVVNISIFRQYREFVFPARVSDSQEKKMTINIEESAQVQYQSFGAAVFSRGPDWPKWLPSRDADQPFPLWAVKAFNAARDSLLSLKMRLDGSGWLSGLGDLIQIWKKR